MIVARHSCRDDGIQSQGRETAGWHITWIRHLRNRKVTVHGSRFRHPGRNDVVLAKMRIAGICVWVIFTVVIDFTLM